MRIVMKVQVEDNNTVLTPGEVVDTLDHVARDFIARGYADPETTTTRRAASAAAAKKDPGDG